jgi:hypothetical protein
MVRRTAFEHQKNPASEQRGRRDSGATIIAVDEPPSESPVVALAVLACRRSLWCGGLSPGGAERRDRRQADPRPEVWLPLISGKLRLRR